MANTDKRKRHITAGEIITVVIVVLCLAAGLVVSFLNFTEKANINTVKTGAMETYSAVSALNVKIENVETATGADIIKEFLPEIFEFGATEEELKTDIQDGKFKDGQYAVSDIKRSASGFTFTYYRFLNGKLYSVQYSEGIIGEVKVLFEVKK